MTHSPNTIPTEPIWRTINRAVKAGQRHPDAKETLDELAGILGEQSSEQLSLHAGVALVVRGLRERNAEILRRLFQSDNQTLVRTVLAGEFIGRAWNRYALQHTAEEPLKIDAISTAYAEANDPRHFGSDAWLKPLWNRFLQSFGQSEKTPGQQFRETVYIQQRMTSEWLGVLPALSQEIPAAAPCDAATLMGEIGSRSVPFLLQAYSMLPMKKFQSTVRDSSLAAHRPAPATYCGLERAQDAAKYMIIFDRPHQPVMTPRSNSAIPSSISTIGCAAKYVKTKDGNVIDSVCKRTLQYWKRSILPALYGTGSRIAPDSRLSYAEALQTLLTGKEATEHRA